MSVKCDQCSEGIGLGSEINPELGLVRCRNCDSVMSIAVLSGDILEKKEIGERKNIKLSRVGHRLVMQKDFASGNSERVMFVLITAVFVGFYAFGFYEYRHVFNEKNLTPLLITALTCLFFIYRGLLLVFNKYTITADYDGVSIKLGPIPAFGNKHFPKGDIENFYCEKYRVKSGKHSYRKVYRVMVDLKNAKNKALIAKLREFEDARKIEQELEAYMRLEDKPYATEAHQSVS